MGSDRTTILFLCTGNSCRSQMAEGWAKVLKSNEIEAWSAGIEKHGMNPLAIKSMAEAGVDISTQRSNIISELDRDHFDWVVTLCGHADETCPYFPGKRLHMGFDDPPTLSADLKDEDEKLVHYNRVRDEIKAFILSLPEALNNN